MQVKPRILGVRILVNIFNTAGIEGRGTALDAMNDISFFKQ